MSGTACSNNWAGVGCDLSDNIILLELVYFFSLIQNTPLLCPHLFLSQHNNDLNGTIPSELGFCTTLTALFFFLLFSSFNNFILLF